MHCHTILCTDIMCYTPQNPNALGASIFVQKHDCEGEASARIDKIICYYHFKDSPNYAKALQVKMDEKVVCIQGDFHMLKAVLHDNKYEKHFPKM